MILPAEQSLAHMAADERWEFWHALQVFFDAAQALMMVVGSFLLLMIVVPFIIPVFIPLGAAFFWVRARYLKASREVKRFEATTRSPVFASFSAILKVGRLVGRWVSRSAGTPLPPHPSSQ